MFMGGLIHVPYTPHDGSIEQPVYRPMGFKVLNASEAQMPPRTLAIVGYRIDLAGKPRTAEC